MRDSAAVAEAAALEESLRALGSAERAVNEKAYLKSDLEFAGTGLPAVRSTVRSWCRDRPALSHDELVAVAGALWNRPVFECRMAAVELLDANAALLRPGDSVLVEQLLRTSGTWALVDGLAANVMGALAEHYPELAATLDRWAGDEDFWLRRSAMLALLKPLRRGEGDFERFGRYADRMLADKEFFIRKAIGWILRDTGRRRPQLVAEWLAPRVQLASGVTVREAVKPLPAGIREQLLAGYREKRPVSALNLAEFAAPQVSEPFQGPGRPAAPHP